ncbi:MAG: hypothetical protein A3C88_00845 [Candidatus Yanofskybacteria bacterium RIFCSPHIGHO2_02_FULL_50_12]|uniref:Uncharacterized protein n=1 Tax=Candidatus Yanofskybacteria bacterium RIFCSPHIGHO2_02_FULL_50_12 TaxID=1802685 RepID=A0A1F8FUS2_9BACT|nr:MAG: hypothetical protein A3C88_00845 [Candidatus Yanofskybacteria bacterium RIFCSPHIGHO2_02_FULL_50_12]
MENMVKKMTIDTLARMTQNEFSRVDERFDKIDNTLLELKKGQERLLEVVLDIPSKKSFERLENKVDSMEIRLSRVERKVK